MEAFVAANPAVALYFIAGLVGAIGVMIKLATTRLLRRFDLQDEMFAKMNLETKLSLANVKARLGSLEFHAWGTKPAEGE